jgi:hypothetical protein
MFLLNGTPISLDVEFTTPDGTRYPANWIRLASPAERAAIGITEAPDPEYYDQRFYWGPNNPKLLNDRPEVKEDGTPLYVQVYDKTADGGKGAMVDTTEQVVTKGLKSQWVAQVKDTAGKLLAQTDWMVTRKVERNIDIPASVVTKRAAIVAECTRLETAIAGCADVPALIAIVTNQNWQS